MCNDITKLPAEAYKLGEKILDKISEAAAWVVTPKGNKKYQLEAEEFLIDEIKKDSKIPPYAKAALISNVRNLLKEYRNQFNITMQALPLIEEKANPALVENDWLSFFYDKAKNVSNEEMQILWSNILAGEFNAPGSCSKALLHIASIMDNKYAQAFEKVMNYIVEIEGRYHVVFFFEKYPEVFSEGILEHEDIFALESIGLLQIAETGYSVIVENDTKLKYFEYEYDIKTSSKIHVGNVSLTMVGEELMGIVNGKNKIEGFEKVLQEITSKTVE